MNLSAAKLMHVCMMPLCLLAMHSLHLCIVPLDTRVTYDAPPGMNSQYDTMHHEPVNHVNTTAQPGMYPQHNYATHRPSSVVNVAPPHGMHSQHNDTTHRPSSGMNAAAPYGVNSQHEQIPMHENVNLTTNRKNSESMPVSYTHLTLPTTPYV